MPWWVWALVVWGALAPLLGVVLGRAIRTAEWRELRCDRPPAEQEDEEPRAS